MGNVRGGGGGGNNSRNNNNHDSDNNNNTTTRKTAHGLSLTFAAQGHAREPERLWPADECIFELLVRAGAG